MYKAWFVSYLGKHFSKVFQSGNEMEDFISRANSVGTRLIGFTSWEGKS